MIKVILFAVIGLVIGLGGGSAVSVMKAKKAYAADVAHKAKVVADSLAKAEEQGAKHVARTDGASDTTAHDSTATDSSVAEAEGGKGAEGHEAPAKDVASSHGDKAAAPASDAEPAAAAKPPKTYSRAVKTVEANGVPRDKPLVVTRPSLPPKPMAAATVPPGAAKLAKIFAAMPAKDAAKVLEQLDDSEVQSVISTLSEKQAAAVIQNFPPERAAKITKAVLRSVPPVKP
ncbi:MAG: hypothetical protein IT359_07955 [Gemmatimonadaceae bacterium]|nr:hypothetical protein [Gemmatimonadaceae bacterium]